MRPDGPERCFGRFTSEKRARGWIVTHEKQGYERIHGREMGEAAIESDGTITGTETIAINLANALETGRKGIIRPGDNART
jgi:hypothetical protein